MKLEEVRTLKQKLLARMQRLEELEAKFAHAEEMVKTFARWSSATPRVLDKIEISGHPVITIKSLLTSKELADAILPVLRQKVENLEEQKVDGD